MSMTRLSAVVGLALLAGGIAAPPARAERTVGVAGPTGGQYAPFGNQMRAGVELAVADINADGGVLGEMLAVETADDPCDPARASAIANQMVGRGVVFVVGHLCSSSSIPASAVYAAEGIVQISPASVGAAYTDERPGPGIYRLAPRADREGDVAGAFLAERFAGASIAILHDTTAYGRTLAERTREALHAAGVRETLFEGLPSGETDYAPVVSTLRAAGADVVFIGARHGEAAVIVRQMRERGMDTVAMAGEALATEEFWEDAGAGGEGTFMTLMPDPVLEPAAAPLVERLAGEGVDHDGFFLPAYAAVQAWAQAVEAAGTFDHASVVEALDDGRFDTVLGAFGFDAGGDATLPDYVIYQWRDGSYAPFDGS